MGVALEAAEQQALLGTHGTAVLATVNLRGAPAPLPVWYVIVDNHLYVRTPRSAKRLSHIASNPRIGLVVHAGHAWRELRGVLITGMAVIVDDEGTIDRVRAMIAERFSELLPPPLPDKVAGHYEDTVILQIDAAGPPTTWDNRKVRL